MFNTEKVIKQTSRGKVWWCLLLSIPIAFFAVIFTPFSYKNPLFWFFAIATISYLFIYYTTGVYSYISLNKKGEFHLCIYNNYNRRTTSIPFNRITHISLCEYQLFKNNKANLQCLCESKDFHHMLNHLGYAGQGLVVCYKEDELVYAPSKFLIGAEYSPYKSCQFPAPNSKEFVEILKQETNLDVIDT